MVVHENSFQYQSTEIPEGSLQLCSGITKYADNTNWRCPRCALTSSVATIVGRPINRNALLPAPTTASTVSTIGSASLSYLQRLLTLDNVAVSPTEDPSSTRDSDNSAMNAIASVVIYQLTEIDLLSSTGKAWSMMNSLSHKFVPAPKRSIRIVWLA